MKCRWQVEIDPYCQRVLAKHWPDVGRWEDVRTFPPHPAKDWAVDVICGGFPCQDISHAGKKQGIDGERSGLWGEFRRIIGDLRPAIVLMENVAALLVRGMDRVCGELAESGYDAEWDVIPASALGAPHIRERVFIVARHVANSEIIGCSDVLSKHHGAGPGESDALGHGSKVLADTAGDRWRQGDTNIVGGDERTEARQECGLGRSGQNMANSNSERRCLREAGETNAEDARQSPSCPKLGPWNTEPDVGRVADGVPDRVDRLRGLGNAVVPQVAQWIGERIIESDNRRNSTTEA